MIKLAIAIVLLSGSTVVAAAQNIVAYRDIGAFYAAAPNLRHYGYGELVNPPPLQFGPFTFKGGTYYNDFVPDVGTYLSSGGLVDVYRSYAVGFYLGSFYGTSTQLPIYVNGKLLITIGEIRRKEITFVGFVSDKRIRTVDFQNRDELDFIDLYAAHAVPEPAVWSMMITGFGLVGSALRQRARVRRSTLVA